MCGHYLYSITQWTIVCECVRVCVSSNRCSIPLYDRVPQPKKGSNSDAIIEPVVNVTSCQMHIIIRLASDWVALNLIDT